jgi:hypothetical protein
MTSQYAVIAYINYLHCISHIQRLFHKHAIFAFSSNMAMPWDIFVMCMIVLNLLCVSLFLWTGFTTKYWNQYYFEINTLNPVIKSLSITILYLMSLLLHIFIKILREFIMRWLAKLNPQKILYNFKSLCITLDK